MLAALALGGCSLLIAEGVDPTGADAASPVDGAVDAGAADAAAASDAGLEPDAARVDADTTSDLAAGDTSPAHDAAMSDASPARDAGVGDASHGEASCSQLVAELATFIADSRSCEQDQDCQIVDGVFAPAFQHCSCVTYLATGADLEQWQALGQRWLSSCSDGLIGCCDAPASQPACLLGSCVPSMYTGPTFASYQEWQEHCGSSACQSEICEVGCGPEPPGGGGCPYACLPRVCSDIPLWACPRDVCQVMFDCNGTPRCYGSFSSGPPACGGESYYGQAVPCCAGLERRCGAPGADGTCDPNAGGYMGFPYCLACGGGACDAWENACSCPEDC